MNQLSKNYKNQSFNEQNYSFPPAPKIKPLQLDQLNLMIEDLSLDCIINTQDMQSLEDSFSQEKISEEEVQMKFKRSHSDAMKDALAKKGQIGGVMSRPFKRPRKYVHIG